MSQAIEPCCGNCKHWDKPLTADYGWGRCEKIVHYDKEDASDFARTWDVERYFSGLETTAAFCCNLHEPQED
jgi:hypothetical protein